jgi:hypothetical protein
MGAQGYFCGLLPGVASICRRGHVFHRRQTRRSTIAGREPQGQGSGQPVGVARGNEPAGVLSRSQPDHLARNAG